MKNIAILFLLLSGCVAALAQESGMATVYFYRYRQMQGSLLRPSVYCDDVPLARVVNGRQFSVKVPAGRHVFTAEDRQAGATFTLEAGKTYYFRTDLQMGFFKGHFRLSLIPAEQGQFDITNLKPLDDEDQSVRVFGQK